LLKAAVKKEAMESSIEEQLRDKEAVQAENAAQQALCLQHEAEVRDMSIIVLSWWPGLCMSVSCRCAATCAVLADHTISFSHEARAGATVV
jgi:hypothetical protein